jgi:hypothetical protein
MWTYTVGKDKLAIPNVTSRHLDKLEDVFSQYGFAKDYSNVGKCYGEILYEGYSGWIRISFARNNTRTITRKMTSLETNQSIVLNAPIFIDFHELNEGIFKNIAEDLKKKIGTNKNSYSS